MHDYQKITQIYEGTNQFRRMVCPLMRKTPPARLGDGYSWRYV